MSSENFVQVPRSFMLWLFDRSPMQMSGGGFGECRYCCSEYDAENYKVDHHQGCPWVIGRKLLCENAEQAIDKDGFIRPEDLPFLCEHRGIELAEISTNHGHVLEGVVSRDGESLFIRQRENGKFLVSDLPGELQRTS